MPTVLNWPTYGEWLLSEPKAPVGRNAGGFYRKASPPFAVLTVNFRAKTGTVRALQNTVPIAGIQLRQTADGPKFSANYAIGAHSGRFEATVFARYELEVDFTGTVVTSVTGRPDRIDGADTAVSSLSTQDKLQEAIRRALPLLPGEMATQVRAIFTPAAIVIMAATAGLWVASHAAGGIGLVADLALLFTGAVLLGWAAVDVGRDLSEFMLKATGASTDQDLDEAAHHFAAAVLKGGPVLIGTLALSKHAGRTQTRATKYVTSRELPPASRGAPPPPLGEQPRNLAGLTAEEAEVVRNLINNFRQRDLHGRPIDCAEAAEALQAASGNKGIVRETHSGQTRHVPNVDHTMWEIGDLFIDTRPGWWRTIFKSNKAARAAINAAWKGLAERLEAGAVLTRAEHAAYQGHGLAPRK